MATTSAGSRATIEHLAAGAFQHHRLTRSGDHWICRSPVEALGHVTLLPAQDRAEELAPAADVFAGVSEGDIACIAANAHRECIDGSPWMAVARAVLDMLRVKLVAALEPDAARRLALAIHAAADAAEES